MKQECGSCRFWHSDGCETCTVTKVYMGFCKMINNIISEDNKCKDYIEKKGDKAT